MMNLEVGGPVLRQETNVVLYYMCNFTKKLEYQGTAGRDVESITQNAQAMLDR